MGMNIVVIGASGAIGNEFIHQLAKLKPDAMMHAFSRSLLKTNKNNIKYHEINQKDDSSVKNSAMLASKVSLIDTVIVATGILHDHETMPEKSMYELSYDALEKVFRITRCCIFE